MSYLNMFVLNRKFFPIPVNFRLLAKQMVLVRKNAIT